MFNSDRLQQHVTPDQFKADCIELNPKDEQYS